MDYNSLPTPVIFMVIIFFIWMFLDLVKVGAFRRSKNKSKNKPDAIDSEIITHFLNQHKLSNFEDNRRGQIAFILESFYDFNFYDWYKYSPSYDVSEVDEKEFEYILKLFKIDPINVNYCNPNFYEPISLKKAKKEGFISFADEQYITFVIEKHYTKLNEKFNQIN